MVFPVGMEGWFMLCQILHCRLLHCYTRTGNKARNKTFSFCGTARMGVCSVLGISIHSLFALPRGCKCLTLKWDVTNAGKATWAGEPSGLCANPQPEKGQRVGVFLLLLHLFPSHLLSYKMLQYLTVITTKIGAWKSLQSLCSSLCRAGLLKAAAWWGASEYRSTTLPWGERVYLSLHTLKLSHFL